MSRPTLALLGAEMRARREALGFTLRRAARACRRSPAWLSRVERGDTGPGTEGIGAMAGLLGINAATYDRWVALAGHMAPDLEAMLLAAPERWADVRALLTGES